LANPKQNSRCHGCSIAKQWGRSMLGKLLAATAGAAIVASGVAAWSPASPDGKPWRPPAVVANPAMPAEQLPLPPRKAKPLPLPLIKQDAPTAKLAAR
jgi:hypothetical protein